jgi:CRISPR-associated protein Csm1
MNNNIPNFNEVILGCFFQDIGKFMQRAHGTISQIPAEVRRRESVILPVYNGHYGYKHVLWSEAFFHWMERQGLSFPGGVNLNQVRNMAAFHHKPEVFGPLGWLAAEADRLSSGMDRKAQDEKDELKAGEKGWDRFIKTPLVSTFSQVDLGLGEPQRGYHPLLELNPDEDIQPRPLEALAIDSYSARYRQLWDGFSSRFTRLCQEVDNLSLFHEALLSLSERYTWAIPSSTVDLPDISLHDHNRTVAAIGACLYQFHEARNELDNEAAIRNREISKFRLLAGDLSGIQHSLFLLAHQQVKGVNKILRGRSFLMGMILEAVGLLCREVCTSSPYQFIQRAGGRFVLLLPISERLEGQVAQLRYKIDSWMQSRYLGELSLNLALSSPFAGRDFLEGRFRQVYESLLLNLEEVKQTALGSAYQAVQPVTYGELGSCQSCDRRPAAHWDQGENGAEISRCLICHEEQRIGGWLPKTQGLSWREGNRANKREVLFFDCYVLRLEETVPRPLREHLSACHLYQGGAAEGSALAQRYLAAYVPLLREGEEARWEYACLSEEAKAVQVGDLKTFEHLAAEAREIDRQGENHSLLGKPFLAVLKADVDRLGFIFGHGLSDPDRQQDRATISRFAQLSRMMDFFFTGRLYQLLATRHRTAYTVYAGGDDLLLIGPWRQIITGLLPDLHQEFRRYVGDNPNITLSAGVELIQANHPLNRAVWRAEERLEQAKDKGRNRVSLLNGQSLIWKQLPSVLEVAEQLHRHLRNKLVSTAFVYRLLYFLEQRRKLEQEQDMNCADWRARWGYHLARHISEQRNLTPAQQAELSGFYNHLLGLTADLRQEAKAELVTSTPVSIALYRHRS